MNFFVDWVRSITVQDLLIYWACYFIIEKLLLLSYKYVAKTRPKAANWLLYNYWETLGLVPPAIWIGIKAEDGIPIPGLVFAVAMMIYYGFIKPSVFKRGKIFYW